jgi:hypothetical protein
MKEGGKKGRKKGSEERREGGKRKKRKYKKRKGENKGRREERKASKCQRKGFLILNSFMQCNLQSTPENLRAFIHKYSHIQKQYGHLCNKKIKFKFIAYSFSISTN